MCTAGILTFQPPAVDGLELIGLACALAPLRQWKLAGFELAMDEGVAHPPPHVRAVGPGHHVESGFQAEGMPATLTQDSCATLRSP